MSKIKMIHTVHQEEIAAIAMISEPIETSVEKKTVLPVTVEYLTDDGALNPHTKREQEIIDNLVFNQIQEWIDWLNANDMFKYEVRLWNF